MTDPKRWRDDPSAPGELRELLRPDAAPRAMRPDEREATRARLATLGATGAATWWITTRAGTRVFVGSKSLVVVLSVSIVSALTAAVVLVAHAAAAPVAPMGAMQVASTAQRTADRAVEAFGARTRPGPPPRMPGVSPDESSFVPTAAPAITDQHAHRATSRTPEVDSLTRESELLQEATRVLEGDPAAALRLADRHAREFRTGQLAAERDYLRVRALARLGRTDDATAAARAFIEAHPSSVFAARLGRALDAGTPLR